MKVSIAPDFANLLPPLTAEEIAILTANCQADPNHERLPPIILWKHKNILVDGHNQYQIRTKLKLKTKFAYIDPETRDEALRYALDVQFGRRNLSASQRAMAYAKLPHNTHGGDRKADQETISSLENLAEKAGVGVSTMKAAIKVADNSPPEIVKAVAAGEAKATDAVAVLELSPKEQLAALAAKRKGKAKTLRGAAFDPEQLEKQPARQQTPKKSGKPVITKENRTDAQKHLGGLIRALKALDIYDEFVQSLSAIATRLKKI